MNVEQLSIIRIVKNNVKSQREISRKSGFSLGKVNRLVGELQSLGYINKDLTLTGAGKDFMVEHHPQRAIILAAGYGMRMVPINTEEPKGLLEVNKEPLIERIIKQLHEVGVGEIHVVVGFMKEHYEYLIDHYGVDLIVNPHYENYKNLYSLYLAKEHLTNSYVIPCDIWFKNNPFSQVEDESWYLFSTQKVSNSRWEVARQNKVRKVSRNVKGNRMVGIAYLNQYDGQVLAKALDAAVSNSLMLKQFWEETLENDNHFMLSGKLIHEGGFSEINSYEQLRDLDFHSNHLQTAAIKVIERTLNTDLHGIKHIQVLKKGMTNRSFFFEHDGQRYIMRIPGEGTGELIDRQKEFNVYQVLKGADWTEQILYLNPKNGYKLSSFINGAHNSDPLQWDQVSKCMALLRKLHSSKLRVDHDFDLYGQIDFYEHLRAGESAYRDYQQVKKRVLQLRDYIDQHVREKVLCHIDANPDNFVFDQDGHLYLIDWEYAGMQDPDVDIAMFAIYAMYNRQQIDKLIDTYYQGECTLEIRYKIYAYVAVCGLLWSNWCEYKQSLGLDFGVYSLAQYRYAKGYSQLVLDKIGVENAKN